MLTKVASLLSGCFTTNALVRTHLDMVRSFAKYTVCIERQFHHQF